MTSRYFDALDTEDAVRLLGNSLNSDHVNPDEYDHSEDHIKCKNSATNLCVTCNAATNNDTNNVQVSKFLSNYFV